MRKILAIDDQKDNLISIQAIINAQLKDVNVIFALSGKEGIETAKKEKPDCILLDIIMPEMNGYDTCKNLKNDQETSSIPIIMLTAIKTDAESRIKGLNMGADAFLSKPIDPTELIAVINVMFRIKSAEDKLRGEKIKLSDKVKDQTKAIIESKTKLSALFENAPTPYFSINEEGLITSVNNEWTVITGYDQKDIINKPFSSILKEIPELAYKDAFNELKDKGAVSNFHTNLVKKDGKTIHIELFGSLESDSLGNYKTSYWIFHDISNQYKAKTEIAESQRKFNTLIGNLKGSAYQCFNDFAFTMKYLSRGFESIFGYDPDDLIDNKKIKFIDLVHPDDREEIHNEIDEQLKAKNSFEIQYRIIDNLGNIHYVVDKGARISEKGQEQTKLEGVIYDISENIKASDEINKFISVIEQNPAIILITDKNGTIEYVNPKFKSVSGFKDEEILGKNISILKSKGSDIDDEDIWNTVASGNTWKGELENVRKDGSVYWEKATIFPVIDYEGNFSNIIKLGEDITEVLRSKEALKESEWRYKSLLDTTTEGFWVIDQNNITIDVNNALCEILEYEKEDILGKKPFDFMDQENGKILQSQIDKRKDTDNRKYNITLKTRTGKDVDARLNASSIKDSKGNFMGSFAFVSDIRDLKKSEKTQQLLYNISKTVTRTENLNELINSIRIELSSIIDTTNFFIALYNKDKNELSLPFFTDQKDDIVSIPIGNSLTDYVIKTREPLLANRKLIDELEKEGKIRYRGAKSKIWLGVPLFLEEEVIGVMVVQSYQDEKAYSTKDMELLEFISNQIAISIDKKRKEDDIKVALEQATESDKLKTAFLQNISHEIRTPMNGIMGFTTLIKDQTPEDNSLHKFLDIILLSSHRMMNTLQDIMDMSLLETQQVTLSINKCNIQEEIKNIAETFVLEAKSKNLNLETEIPDNIGEIIISTDKDKLKAVVSNLLKNAIKFTSVGSVRVGFRTKNDELLFHVIDTGIGIPENRIEVIFDKFIQADISDIKVHEGMGIGLTIAKSYIEKLGGKLWVKSKVGEGSEFYFTLPYSSSKNVTKSLLPTNNSDKLPEKNLKILIVEDEQFTAEFFKIVLEKNKNELLFAGDGITAVELARKNPDLDLILMDIKLPKMDGYAATTSIRTFNKDVKIIAQTAYALAGDNEKARDVGCDDYLTKPINQKKLFELLNKHFQ